MKYQEYHEQVNKILILLITYYVQLAKIIQGEDNGTVDSEEATKYGIIEADNKETGIPEFWKDVLIYSKFFEINEKDEEVLKHLKNVDLKLSEGSLDFTVNFHFEQNDFFDNETLFKTFVYDSSTFEPVSANVSTINWKEGKNPGLKLKAKKKKSKFNY